MQALSVIPPGRDRSQWLGGADIAAVLGISPWTTPLKLWEAKTHPGAVEAAATGVRRRGVRWEGAVAEMLVEDLQARGHAVEIVASNLRYQDPEHAFMAAEIDFEVRLDGEAEVTNVELAALVHLVRFVDRQGRELQAVSPAASNPVSVLHRLRASELRPDVCQLVGREWARLRMVLDQEGVPDVVREGVRQEQARFAVWQAHQDAGGLPGRQPPQRDPER